MSQLSSAYTAYRYGSGPERSGALADQRSAGMPYRLTSGAPFWHSGRTSVSDRRTFAVLRLTGDHVGKPSAVGQPTMPTQPFILSG